MEQKLRQVIFFLLTSTTSSEMTHKTHRHMQNRILSFVLLFLTITVANGQEKKWEPMVSLSMGGYGGGDSGITFKAGIGLGYRLSQQWSIVPGVEFIAAGELGESFDETDNEDKGGYVFLHIPLQMQYHCQLLEDSKQDLIIGIGPSLNFTIDNNKYWFDHELYNSPFLRKDFAERAAVLDGKDKIKKFNIGIQPSVMYQFNHVRLGFDANFGLLDLNKKYAVSTKKHYFFHIWSTFTYRF